MDHILKTHEIVKTDLVRGQGASLFDSRGREYVDFESGIWCVALGHTHPRVVATMQAQAETLVHLGTRYVSDLAEAAAIDLLETLSLPNGKAVFLSSGSEAVEFAVQAARRLSGRPLLLGLAGSYLGAYGSAGTRTGSEWHNLDWEACPACTQRRGCDASCPRLAQIPWESIGGLVLEPGNMQGRVRLPPKELVTALAAQTRDAGGLLVANEITTGMGRTGRWYGFEHYSFRPDLVALGKGLGNGYPVSAVALSTETASRLEGTGLRYAQSHQNDPLGCAVANEVLAVLREEGLIERSARVGERFLEALRALGRRASRVREARGRGLMLALELETGEAGVSAGAVEAALRERGFLVGLHPAANLLRFYPPLTIPETAIDRLLEALGDLLEVVS